MTERLAISSMAHGADFKRVAAVSFPVIEGYAKKIGADFVPVSDECVPHHHTHWEKMRVAAVLEKYDRVAWFDGDVIVNPRAESIFDLVPEQCFAAMDEAAMGMDRASELRVAEAKHGLKLPADAKRYFNAGVTVFSKRHAAAFVLPKDLSESPLGMAEQSYLNAMTLHLGFEFFALPREWNAFYGMWPPDRRANVRVLHYAAHGKGGKQADELVERMKTDLALWG